jgi:hypothetical protein
LTSGLDASDAPADLTSRAALEAVLARYLAIERFDAQSVAYLFGAGVPTLVFWIDASVGLPDLVEWLAICVWFVCFAMSLVLALLSARKRAELATLLAKANRIARVRFTTADATRIAPSALLAWLSTAAGAVLWIHAVAPSAFRAETVELCRQLWAVLFAGALANRYFEHH